MSSSSHSPSSSTSTSLSLQVRPPQTEQKLEQKSPPKAVAGMGAVVSTFKEISKHTGVWEGMKLLAKVNQKEGFDCPGCAWPDPAHRSAFEFCENGAKAVAAEGTRKRVGPSFFKEWSIEELSQKSDYWLENQGRLTHPMYKAPQATHYTPISWTEAFEQIGRKLQGLSNPNRAVFYTSGRTSNEAAYLYQLFARFLGTNNLPDCSNMCHESSGRGLGETLGTGKGTVQLSDFEHAECILIMGQNPATNHPRMLSSLEKAAKRGCKIIAVNPLKERGLERFAHPQNPLALLGSSTPISTHFLQVKINGDVALLKGIMKALFDLEEEAQTQNNASLLDRDFIQNHTVGFDEFKTQLDQILWADIVTHSGIEEEHIREVAQVYAHSKASIVCWAMGLTQHQNGVDNIREVVNLLLLKGNIGRQGAGACPVRGHSNVQGDRTMGIVERPPAPLVASLKERFHFDVPLEHGYDVVKTIEAMNANQVDVFMAMGGNFLSATPDTDQTAQGLSQCQLTVQVSTKLNRSHLITGQEALILPCRGRTEIDLQGGSPQFVTVENSMSIVHRSQGKRPPASEHLMSEPGIICSLAQATFKEDSSIPWADFAQDYRLIRQSIEATISGFTDYEARSKEGFVLPNGARDRQWNVEGGKAKFTSQSIPQHPLKEGEFLMMTVRSHDQYNTTIYGWDDRYRGIYGDRRIVMMAPQDIKKLGWTEGQKVDIHSWFQNEQRTVFAFRIVQHDLPQGCVATYFPEANPLVPLGHTARISNTPASKSICVTFTLHQDH